MAYLDDGMMIVVDGKRYIQTIPVLQSVLQTAAGRMISLPKYERRANGQAGYAEVNIMVKIWR